MLNIKNHIFRLILATPNFFDLVSGKGPSYICMIKIWKELNGALIGDLDASTKRQDKNSILFLAV
jgi:hypothetical protein